MSSTSSTTESWSCPASLKAGRTSNPIRAVVDRVLSSAKPRTDDLSRIPLSLGDPAAFGNLPPPQELTDAIAACAAENKYNGYIPATGLPAATAAVASHYSTSKCPIKASDVVMASGCSGALELCITAMLNDGENILVPNPGFALYEVIAKSHGAEVLPYNLDPNTGWECDLEHMESLITPRTRGILVNNPSNPCGSVFSEAHLGDIVRLAAKHRLPIVADEVYGGMTWGPKPFIPISDVAASLGWPAPVISASGLAKQFLVPGWRVGWLVFYDTAFGAIAPVKEGVCQLANVVLGASHLLQAAIPKIFAPEDAAVAESIKAFRTRTNGILEENSDFTCEQLASCYGLRVVPSSGAMYVMVEILVDQFDDKITDDVDFTGLLLDETNVFALPGSCFGAKNFFRVVFCAPKPNLGEAYDRIKAFCDNHKKA
jgi:tyrosine aminotransferase